LIRLDWARKEGTDGSRQAKGRRVILLWLRRLIGEEEGDKFLIP